VESESESSSLSSWGGRFSLSSLESAKQNIKKAKASTIQLNNSKKGLMSERMAQFAFVHVILASVFEVAIEGQILAGVEAYRANDGIWIEVEGGAF